MSRDHDDFAVEPVPGLPEAPPASERILWQGRPSWRALARRALKTRLVAGWFVLLAGWRAADMLANGDPMREAAISAVWLVGLGALAAGVLCLIAWAMARTTVYTITTRRVAMRIGVALDVTLNLPFRWIASADLKLHADGSGDIPLTLGGPSKIGYLVLWPHARPWAFARPAPMLRCVADAEAAARTLSSALRADMARREAEGEPVAAAGPAHAPVPRPAPTPRPMGGGVAVPAE